MPATASDTTTAMAAVRRVADMDAPLRCGRASCQHGQDARITPSTEVAGFAASGGGACREPGDYVHVPLFAETSLRGECARMRSRRSVRATVASVLCAGIVASTGGVAHAVTPNGPDLEFILEQIKRAEAHAGGGRLLGTGPDQVSSPL